MPKRGRSSLSGRGRKVAKRRALDRAGFVRSGRRRTMRTRRGLRLDRHDFTRYAESFTVTTSAVEEDKTWNFMLTDVINYAEFTAMFDQYKIKAVDFKIQMINNPDAAIMPNNDPSATNNSNNFYPKFWYIKDYDGGGADTLSQIKERVGVKFFIMRPNKEFTIRIKPKILVQTYKTLTTTGYAPKAMFVDCADNSVPHYGLNAVIDCLGLNPTDATGFRFRIDYKFHLAFKGVR